jgi:dTDP-4-amino-4,6-dideoxygalactose transaminase
MLSEIGSIFWDVEINNDNYNLFENGRDSHYLLSGRTALDFIIKDIKVRGVFKKVYMPSYCCRSMILPFLKNNIEVAFYDVVRDEINGYKCSIEKMECDAVLVIRYFGFECGEADRITEIFKKQGKVVIEDATHSIFSDIPYSRYSDYVFASFRKWTGLIAGAIAINMNDRFLAEKTDVTNEHYMDMRKKVILMKKHFMESSVSNRAELFDLHKLSEELLYEDYQDFTITAEIKNEIRKLDIKKIRKQRQENAKYLIGALIDNRDIRSIYKSVSERDCPLYVPIYTVNKSRDQLKAFLGSRQIFCPSHWLFSDVHKISSKARDLYDNSLSLVCDQRYNTGEMERIVKTICEYYSNSNITEN